MAELDDLFGLILLFIVLRQGLKEIGCKVGCVTKAGLILLPLSLGVFGKFYGYFCHSTLQILPLDAIYWKIKH